MVIHTAGLISIANKVSDALRKVNVEGTKNIIEKCIRYGVKRLVYISSVHALPEKPKGQLIEETEDFDPDRVVGGYAKTKAEASRMVMEAHNKGLDTVILHPSGIMGPGDTGGNHANQMIRDYVRGRLPASVKGGYAFVDVRDVAAGVLAAVDKGSSGGCYILSEGYYTVGELLSYVRELTGGKKLPQLPLWFARVMSVGFEIYAKLLKQRPLFTRYSLYTLQSNGCFSNQKVKEELDFAPRPLRQTVKDMVLEYCSAEGQVCVGIWGMLCYKTKLTEGEN